MTKEVTITRREMQVAGFMMEGIRPKEIATALFISLSTVKRHVQNLYRKAGVSNRIQLIRLMFELGCWKKRAPLQEITALWEK